MFRVEWDVEAQVQESTHDGRRQRQPCQHHRLLVRGRCHHPWWYESTAEDQRWSETAVHWVADQTSDVPKPASFRHTVPCHQEGAMLPVADWTYWQRRSPDNWSFSARAVQQRTNRWMPEHALIPGDSGAIVSFFPSSKLYHRCKKRFAFFINAFLTFFFYFPNFFINKKEYVLWNAVSVPLMQFNCTVYCCRAHVTLAKFPFQIFFSGHVRTCLWACLPN